MSSYNDNRYNTNYEDASYVHGSPGIRQEEVRVHNINSPSVPISSMAPNQSAQEYKPYAGAYSESTWDKPSVVKSNKARLSTAKGNSLDEVNISRDPYATTIVPKNENYDKGNNHSFVGFKRMGGWHATRFIFYVLTRIAQMGVAVVCIAFLAESRRKRSYDNIEAVERNTQIAIFVVGGLTALTALISILLHLCARTRQRIEKSRLSWFTLVLSFVIFGAWVVLVLINIIVVDCSKKVDGSWCRDLKVSSATGLISALLAMIIVLRSFSMLVRAGRINMRVKQSNM
ncbi:hypothetical protein BX661DRAFT_199625 [Kickxella alabastrina]|uniref:uncharacterized protein n=1 Tax=Kickxella alabastrina TaxID=61397 RepID=UPI0022209661|nr:uncharacterized protein BX661DRAFT_199625 [Kickxella alabastrina]KAI7824455.1 hypothetical protein BX661DRAFT_199625 [Kickxella alabastrina]KAJ1944684.1 hypothetical protein GGF37_002078 [Kickxella alabastrina]